MDTKQSIQIIKMNKEELKDILNRATKNLKEAGYSLWLRQIKRRKRKA